MALIAYKDSPRAPLFNCEMGEQSFSSATLRALVMTPGERPQIGFLKTLVTL